MMTFGLHMKGNKGNMFNDTAYFSLIKSTLDFDQPHANPPRQFGHLPNLDELENYQPLEFEVPRRLVRRKRGEIRREKL